MWTFLWMMLLVWIGSAERMELDRHLSINEILDSRWEFMNDNGFLGYITFKDDWTIVGY